MLRIPTNGNATQITKAATHRICRYRAATFRISRLQIEAPAATAATCHNEFTRRCRTISLILLIRRLLFEKLLKLRELCGGQAFRFDKTHHQTLGRPAEHSIDEIAKCLPDRLTPGNSRAIKISLVL